MRERPSLVPQSISGYGITPAYAGKTLLALHEEPEEQDHPRVCGKDVETILAKPFVLGSPPRMRERLNVLFWLEDATRITPAYAGKTPIHDPAYFMIQDHPRVCGKDRG